MSSYRRKRNYRRKAYKSKPYFMRFQKGDSLAIKALKMARNLKKVVNVEFKDLVHNGSITPNDSTGDVRAMGGINIDQGDTSSTRDGRSVKLTSWFMRAILYNSASATSDTTVRMVLVHDKQVNQSLASASDIVENVGLTGLMNRDNADRFKVLFDKTFILKPSYSGEVANISFQKYIPLNLHIKYDGTGGGIADITSNELLLFTVSNQATNTPTIAYRTRVKFVDN